MDKKQLRREFIGFISFFYALPIMLLYFQLLPFRLYYAILMLMGLLLAAYSIQRGIPVRELGMRRDNLKKALTASGIFSLLAMLLIFLCAYFKLLPTVNWEGGWGFFIFYVFISAPIQEFVFRSLLLRQLGLFFGQNTWAKIIVSALIFSAAHAFFRSWSVLAVTFISGLVWAYIYEKYPNFWAVTASHAFLGAISVALGIV